MNVAEKCDGMTRLILKKERVENEKAESNREFNEELKQIDQDLLTIARERTDPDGDLLPEGGDRERQEGRQEGGRRRVGGRISGRLEE